MGKYKVVKTIKKGRVVLLYNENYNKLLDSMFEGVYFVDNNRKITFWNKSAEQITGFSANEVVGKYCSDNILKHVDNFGKQLCLGGCPLHKTLETKDIIEAKVFLHHKSGHRVPVAIKTVPLFENGVIVGAAEVFQDISKRNELKEQLGKYKNLALIDQLTLLPNRRFTEIQIQKVFKEYIDFKLPFAIAFFDIDHFKVINDNYSHNVGDDILKMLAQTYMNNIKSSDFIGRWGGEEFLAIFTNCDEQNLLSLIDRIRILVENSSFKVDETELKATISIGATIVKPEDDFESIVKRADELMYRSKENGRNRCSID